MDVQLFQNYLLKRSSFLYCVASAPLLQIIWLYKQQLELDMEQQTGSK